MDGVAATSGLAVLRREAPLHAVMIAVMAVCLLSRSTVVGLAGCAVLVVIAVACAALARRSGHFAAQCIDLWAMALGMLALMVHPAAGHHGAGAPGVVLYVVVLAAWGAARVALARAGTRSWRVDAASAALTAAGLALMLALH